MIRDTPVPKYLKTIGERERERKMRMAGIFCSSVTEPREEGKEEQGGQEKQSVTESLCTSLIIEG